MATPTVTAEDVFLRVLLQEQAKVSYFERWIPVVDIVDFIVKVGRESLLECRDDYRPVPGNVYKLVIRLAGMRLLEFDLDHKGSDWFLDTTRVKLTAFGVYTAMQLEPVVLPEPVETV
jgi:hypothetical protein